MIDWKAMAHHQRYLRTQSEALEVALKRQLWDQQDRRVRLANAVTDVLADLAPLGYAEVCRGCARATAHVDHAPDCWYLRLLEAVHSTAHSI